MTDISCSIVIPAYNAEAFVATAIASALTQTQRDIEVIVVDDGSSDGTAAIVATAAKRDLRLRVVRHERNRGVSAARNSALAVARGRWIALLDADDAYAPERIERLVAQADARGADLLADNLVVLEGPADAGRPELAGRRAFPDDRMSFEGFISPAAFATLDRPRWGLQAIGFMKPIMRRAFLASRKLTYAEDMAAGEDFHLYMRALLKGGKLAFTTDALYRYHLRPRSLSRGDRQRFDEGLLAGSVSLRAAALRAGDHAAHFELQAREADLRNWMAYATCADAFEERKYASALRLAFQIPSRTYLPVRLAAMVRASVVQRSGRALMPSSRRLYGG